MAPERIAATAIEGAMNAVTATSKTVQAMGSEILDMARETIDHSTRTLDLLCNTRLMDEIVAFQTEYVKDFFALSAHHLRRLEQLYSCYPGAITKSYQDAWLRAVNAAVVATQEARQTTSDNIRSYAEAARRASSALENREQVIHT
jgi:uncharacterized protein YukE